MPPLDAVLALLPAEEDDAAVAQVREVTQAAVKILDLDAEPEDLLGALEEVAHGRGVSEARGRAAALARALGGAPGFGREAGEQAALAVDPLEQAPELGQERIGFFDGKESHH